MNEIHHRVSQEGSNAFFELAKRSFHSLMTAKDNEKIATNVPTYNHIRRKLYEKKVPKISFEVCYQNKSTGEVTILKDVETIPTKEFPRTLYEKQYEIASVKVHLFIVLLSAECFCALVACVKKM